VSQDELETRIQDYLDGAMSEDERRAFEASLAEDRELARRIDSYRAAANALREDAPSLSPGFYTRLRAEFETRRAPSRRWFRLLSWETAGLATAVLIAVVMFAPLVLRQDLSYQAPLQRAVQETEPQRQDEFEEIPPLESKGDLGKQQSGRGVPEGRESLMEDADVDAKAKDSSFAPSPPTAPVSGDKESKKLEESVESSVVTDSVEEELRSRSSVAKSAPAKRVEQANEPAEEATPTLERDESSADDYREGLRVAPGVVAGAAVPMGVGLPPGVVQPGSLIEIASRTEWDALMEGPGGEALAAFGTYDASDRIVLVGPRTFLLDCRHSSVVPSVEAYEIRLVELPSTSPERAFGCAFRLPRDNRPVRVVEPGENR
jgi:hypothetical protein